MLVMFLGKSSVTVIVQCRIKSKQPVFFTFESETTLL